MHAAAWFSRIVSSVAIPSLQVLAVFPYESSRKRMSVIVRLGQHFGSRVGGEESIRLYTKGADSVLLALLSDGSQGSDPASITDLNKTLNNWADIALRTLVFAKREIPEDKWNAWFER